MRIGVLGATGPAGSSLSARLASVGFEVVIGSRSKYKAMEARDALLERWAGRELRIDAGDNRAAADTDLVVVATPWIAAASTVHHCRFSSAADCRLEKCATFAIV